MKSLVLACCLLGAILLVKAQEEVQIDEQLQQEGTGRYARSAYHYDGGSSGGGGGGGGGGGSSGGGHHDEVEYGAHTGEKGAFEWHTHHPVGHH